jgi:hypothetical protein
VTLHRAEDAVPLGRQPQDDDMVATDQQGKSGDGDHIEVQVGVLEHGAMAADYLYEGEG